MAEGPLSTAAEFRTAYREVLDGIDSVTARLDDAGFQRDTGCPGWTVHDCVAHVAALESLFIGREMPPHQAPERPYVRSSFGAFMEIGVDLRRGWSRTRLLDEFREVAIERLHRLDAITDSDLDRDSQGLFGPAKLRSVLTIRVFDIWTHQQDIRRATDQPGGFDGMAGRNARERMLRGVAANLVEAGVASDGLTLIIELTEPVQVRRGIVFEAGRGRVVDTVDQNGGAVLRADMNTFTVLCCGRSDDPGAKERVHLSGDQALGRRILDTLAFTP